ncbi:MAG TPA: tetratricopeptide repeat protein [Polyangiaceae bacterium]|nr:tetratricopeptide repeat protein [Polyangiaceae bacterium]
MRVRSGALILSALVTAFFAASAGWGQETQVEGLRAAAAMRPRDLDAALALERALRRAGRWNEAETELRRATPLAGPDPKAAAAIDVELALVYIDRGDFARAFATCEKVFALAGAAAEGHACVANAHLLRQRASEALIEAAQALSRDAGCFDAYVAQGRAYELELDAGRAETSLREALRLRPNESEAHRALGRVLRSQGKKDEGIAELRKAVDLDPSDPNACFELAMAIAPGSERARLLERSTRERPSFTKAWVALATERLESGRISDAKDAADAAARIAPGNVEARLLLGRVALAEGRLDDAVRAGQQVLQSVANSAPAQLLVADGSARRGEIDVAIEAYQAAWGLDHGTPTALVHASDACHAAGRDTSARAFGVRATQEFPQWAPAWEALGNALAAQGERQGAREAYSKALAARDGEVDHDALLKKLTAVSAQW